MLLRPHRAAAALAVLSLALAGCAPKSPTSAAAQAHEEDEGPSLKDPAKRNPAPDFELKDAGGKPVRLADYKGKVVLLNFWATWCGPCKFEIPWFIEFQKTYKDRGFTVIGVSLDEEGWEVVKPYLEAKQVNYPVVIGSEEVDQKYGGIEALPTSFLLDRDGRIAATHVGLVSKSQYEDDIKKLLD